MIELNFDFEKITSTDIKDIPNEMLLAVISETCFLIPVQLIVDDNNLFQLDQEEWIELPAFDIILNWRNNILGIPDNGKGVILLADAGQLNIKRINNLVELSTNFNNVEVTTSLSFFKSRITENSDILLKALNDNYPEIFKIDELSVLERKQFN